MESDRIRIAIRIAMAIGRHDWWNLKSEHAPYEWALLKTLFGSTNDGI